MEFAVIASKQDIAGMNIAKHLKDVYIIEEDSIHAEDVDKQVDADFIIFATRHKSEAGTPSLSVHAPGNWHKAEAGGQPEKICPTSAQALKFLFQQLTIVQEALA